MGSAATMCKLKEVLNLMRKSLIVWTALLILLGVTTLATAQQSGTANSQADFSGVYDITITTEQGQQQTAPIMIQDMKNGRFEFSGDLQGYPFTVEGELTGDVEDGGAVGRFDVNKFGLIKAQGEFTISRLGNQYQLQGQIDGSYSYGGKKGQIAGNMIGTRRGAISTPTPTPTPDSVPAPEQEPARSPISTVAVLAGLIILTGILAYAVRSKR